MKNRIHNQKTKVVAKFEIAKLSKYRLVNEVRIIF